MTLKVLGRATVIATGLLATAEAGWAQPGTIAPSCSSLPAPSGSPLGFGMLVFGVVNNSPSRVVCSLSCDYRQAATGPFTQAECKTAAAGNDDGYCYKLVPMKPTQTRLGPTLECSTD